MADEPLGAAPGRAAARLAKAVEVALSEVDLTLPQFRLLAFLSEGSEAATALAAKLAVSRPSVTALVDGLVARGLVERRPDVADRRRVGHELTVSGRRALADGDAAIEARLTRLAELLPPAKARRAVEGLTLWTSALDAARAAKVVVAQ